jgi:hypothetical protein
MSGSRFCIVALQVIGLNFAASFGRIYCMAKLSMRCIGQGKPSHKEHNVRSPHSRPPSTLFIKPQPDGARKRTFPCRSGAIQTQERQISYPPGCLEPQACAGIGYCISSRSKPARLQPSGPSSVQDRPRSAYRRRPRMRPARRSQLRRRSRPDPSCAGCPARPIASAALVETACASRASCWQV